VKKARASPKLKHEHIYHKLKAIFLTGTHITRSIAVRNKKKKKKKRQKLNEKKQKQNVRKIKWKR
jgi:hypothetical protein